MPCYSPLEGYRSKSANPSGKRSIVFNPNQGFRDLKVTLPCGQCIGCRLEKSRQMAIRCVNEAQLHEHNCFVTLTYSDEHLPKDNSLDHRDFQLFMKKLRKRFGKGVKYYMCGEYGENFGRPHFHVCLFNVFFKDRKPWRKQNGYQLYRSDLLETLWDKGHSSIGDLTFETAAYTARYVTKKITGKKALEHYNIIDKETGEILQERRPEYQTGSKRPAVGREWFEKYTKEIYPDDFIVVRGKKMKPPKYYDARFELDDPEACARQKAARKVAAKEHEANNTWDRKLVREYIQKAKAKLLKRSYENEQS